MVTPPAREINANKKVMQRFQASSRTMVAMYMTRERQAGGRRAFVNKPFQDFRLRRVLSFSSQSAIEKTTHKSSHLSTKFPEEFFDHRRSLILLNTTSMQLANDDREFQHQLEAMTKQIANPSLTRSQQARAENVIQQCGMSLGQLKDVAESGVFRGWIGIVRVIRACSSSRK